MSEVGRYIRGEKLNGYNGYCPITQIWGNDQTDGSFLCTYGAWTGTSFSKSDFINNPGFVVIHIGNTVVREATVETAASALHQSLRSLFAGCGIPVDFERIRTATEFSEFMKHYRGTYSHVVLIGHGTPEGIPFLDKPTPIAGAELSGLWGADRHPTPIQILSLCCHSGCEGISRALSSAEKVTEVLAPAGAFDIRWAVHFVVSYFLNLYISGMSVEGAVAKSSDAAHTRMCIWRNGILQPPCATPAVASASCDSTVEH